MIPKSIKSQDVIKELGFVATRAQLLEHLTRWELQEAVANGHLARVARGRYALPGRTDARRAAMRLSGTASHLSAALLHGWKVAKPPGRPWVTVPRNRNLLPGSADGVHVVFADAHGRVTAPVRTVIDCARRLPFGQALSVADSALRSGDVDQAELIEAAAPLRGPGARQCRRVAREAHAKAANPFESCLRAIALDVGLTVCPQREIELPGRTVHPDLVDEEHGLVLEADSYLHHARDPQVFRWDLWRYTSLTVLGWRVLRLGHYHVMSEPEWVADCLRTCARTGG